MPPLVLVAVRQPKWQQIICVRKSRRLRSSALFADYELRRWTLDVRHFALVAAQWFVARHYWRLSEFILAAVTSPILELSLVALVGAVVLRPLYIVSLTVAVVAASSIVITFWLVILVHWMKASSVSTVLLAVIIARHRVISASVERRLIISVRAPLPALLPMTDDDF